MMLFCFNQKTAYEMRISDWSSDVCSSDLIGPERNPVPIRAYVPRAEQPAPSQLEGLYVTGREGRQIPLAELVRRTPTEADKPIQRKDNERVIFIGGELSHSVPVYAVLDLNRSEEHTSELQSLMRISYDVFCSTKKKNRN